MRGMQRAMLAAALSLGALAGAAAPAAPRLQGTFIQLLSSHGTWSQGDWRELFGCFRELGLQQLVVQWSAYDETAFFPSTTRRAVPNPPLPIILQLAEEQGMQVLVGLSTDSNYWQRIGRDAAQTRAYLQTLLQRASETAVLLAPLVKPYRSFAGWYVSEEIDDLNWQEPAARDALAEHLRALGAHLRALTPDARIAVTGFANAATPPHAVEALWRSLLAQASDLDLVLFQDGVGAGKLQLDEVGAYLDAVDRAARAHGRQMQTVVEVFRQTAGPPLTQGAFEAEPAALESIRLQLELAAAHSAGNVAFGVPEYLCPLGGLKAAQLHLRYLDELRRSKP